MKNDKKVKIWKLEIIIRPHVYTSQEQIKSKKLIAFTCGYIIMAFLISVGHGLL